MAYNIPACEEIAQIAKDASGPIKLSELSDILGYAGPKAVAPRVTAAWWYYDSIGDGYTQGIIERTFVNKDGLLQFK